MALRTITLALAIATIASTAGCGAKGTAEAKTGTVEEKAAAKSGEKGEHAEGGLKLSAEDAKRAGVKTEAIAPAALADAITVTATIHPNQDRIARIAPRVEGRVVATAVSLGDHVRSGKTLATLDSPVIGEAASAWIQAQSSYRVAEADYKRAESLNADEIIPQKEFHRAKAEFEKAGVALRAAQDKLRLLGVSSSAADRHGGQPHVESTFPVAAPFAGIVIEKRATVGQLATPADSLFVVADLSKVWIEADLTEDMLSKVRIGAEASVKIAAYPDERFAGRLTYVAATLDKEKRTVPARIEVDNKDGRLKPEMFATATINTSGAHGAPAAQALAVPDQAIVLMQGVPSVFVFEHGGYEQRAIETGPSVGGRTVVKSGLNVGEEVVVAGTYALKARVLKSQISDEH